MWLLRTAILHVVKGEMLCKSMIGNDLRCTDIHTSTSQEAVIMLHS